MFVDAVRRQLIFDMDDWLLQFSDNVVMSKRMVLRATARHASAWRDWLLAVRLRDGLPAHVECGTEPRELA